MITQEDFAQKVITDLESEAQKSPVDSTLEQPQKKFGAPATWVLSNHDVVRHATRFAPGQSENPTVMPTPHNADRG